MSPMLTTQVPGSGGASTHRPAAFFTCSAVTPSCWNTSVSSP